MAKLIDIRNKSAYHFDGSTSCNRRSNQIAKGIIMEVIDLRLAMGQIKQLLAYYGEPSTIKRSDRVVVGWIKDIPFLVDDMDTEICIGERCFLVPHEAACRVAFALIVEAKLELIIESIAIYENKGA